MTGLSMFQEYVMILISREHNKDNGASVPRGLVDMCQLPCSYMCELLSDNYPIVY